KPVGPEVQLTSGTLHSRLGSFDAIRKCEHRHDFGDEFPSLARSVYKTNDRRVAALASAFLAGSQKAHGTEIPAAAARASAGRRPGGRGRARGELANERQRCGSRSTFRALDGSRCRPFEPSGFISLSLWGHSTG